MTLQNYLVPKYQANITLKKKNILLNEGKNDNNIDDDDNDDMSNICLAYLLYKIKGCC